LTEVVFSADPFASKVVEYLVSRALEIPNELAEIVAKNRPSYSECEFRINGLDLADKPESSENPSLTFRATKFSSESSLEHGLISDSEARLIRFAVLFFASLLPSAIAPYTNPDEVLGFPEGAVSHVLVNQYERDPRNRKAAIELHGTMCMACGFDFESAYGSIGRGYIVIHHTTPVSAMGADYRVDPANDLVAICANCHSMVHREDPPIKLEELRKIIRDAQAPKPE
jgi:5-methylcytosine-specific restriction protein A